MSCAGCKDLPYDLDLSRQHINLKDDKFDHYPKGYCVDRLNKVEIPLIQHGDIESPRDRQVDCNGCSGQAGKGFPCPEVKEGKTADCKCENCCGGKPKFPETSFETCLTYEQVLICKCRRDVPRPKCDAPKDIFGKFKIKFSRGLTKAFFKIWVFNAVGDPNPNTKVTSASLHAGRADQIGPIIVNLFTDGRAGVKVNGLLREGYITNQSIRKVLFNGHSYSSVASLFDAIRRGEVYVQVNGSGVVLDRIQYQDGLLRGQIFARETS